MGLAIVGVLACGRTRPPDLIVVVVDTLRADRIGPGPHAELAPFLGSLVAQGARFTHAYAPSSWTSPSVASLLTSRYPSQHGVVTLDAVLRPEELTVNERLQPAGYYQAAFVANIRLDLAHGFGQGFDSWFPILPDDASGEAKPRARRVGRAAVELLDHMGGVWTRGWRRWLKRRPPLHLYLHFMEPHAPYVAPAGVIARRDPGLTPETVRRLNDQLVAVDWRPLGPPEVARLEALYDAEVCDLDEALRELFEALRARGFLERAVVVVTADHGEEFREHGQLGHGLTLYNEVLRVPLAIVGPGIPAGRVIDAPVSLLDVAPTLLDLLGLAPEPRFEGRSRVAWLRGDVPAPDDVLAELPPNGTPNDVAVHAAAIVRAQAKVIRHRPRDGGPGPVEGFDLERDPGERAAVPAPPALLHTLDERMAWLAAQAPVPLRAPLDPATAERLRALGYVGAAAPPPR